jgi:putative ABC transport system permease protein
MNAIIELNILQFSLIYSLLLIVLFIMKRCKISKTKMLLIASMRMSVQLALAGFILTYIFKNPHPVFTILYLTTMTLFSIYTVLSRNKGINKKFKLIVAISLSIVGLCIIFFFITVVIGVSIFNQQYIIPISGMIFGNAMTGVSLGLKTFDESIKTQRNKIDTLVNIGVTPDRILSPFANQALETAILPTLNSMIGMGIISLPGMMTGQILSGTIPTTAILYQIAIIIAQCTVTCLAVFCSLHFGCKTLYNKRNQMLI